MQNLVIKKRVDQKRLYLISPPKLKWPYLFNTVQRLMGFGIISILQLRLKNENDDSIRRVAKKLLPVCHKNNVALIINDRADLAAETKSDGVHIGQSDMPCSEARRLLGKNALIGVSCHDSLDLATRAVNDGANYVAFGSFFPTKTKKRKGRPTTKLLKDWKSKFKIPTVAIGGIDPKNSIPLINSGADFVAVMSNIWKHQKTPWNRLEIFRKSFNKNLKI